MKFSEAMKLLEEGKKVRITTWEEGDYLCKGTIGDLVNKFGINTFFTIDGEWEEYIEEGKGINVHSKIEELDEKKFAGCDDLGKIWGLFYKLNEVTKELNRRK